MEQLSDELMLEILLHLSSKDAVCIQLVSRRLYFLARDNGLWKRRCFEESRSEVQRRRQELRASQDPRLVALWRAAHHIPGNLVLSDSNVLPQPVGSARAMANWDPSYPSEEVDFYQDYIQRHAPVSVAWMESARHASTHQELESVGIGTLYSEENAALKAIAPLEDGSIAIWDINLRSSSRGRIVARTQEGLLSTSPGSTMSSETGAVESVSVDSSQQRCYIATFDSLNEIDLNTLQVVRQQMFPFPLTSLSEARHPIPLTVGTNNTLHLYDTRVNLAPMAADPSIKCELIGGTMLRNDFVPGFTVSKAHTSLPQPGPLSILHLPAGGDYCDIWVAGRFTSLLHYDRRFWPRIKDTVFSGARLSALSYLSYPLIPRELDLVKCTDIPMTELSRIKASPGITVIAAGEYNGKGSLELFGLSPGTSPSKYANRQTASTSRLLSVCPHGTSLVYSDGDGNIKWVERNGSAAIRQLNIKESLEQRSPKGLSATESEEVTNDIVQKILPMRPRGSGQDKLLIRTGDGRLGMIGFGQKMSLTEDDLLEGETAEEALLERQEKLYGERMRNALERHADETRFVRGLGAAMGML